MALNALTGADIRHDHSCCPPKPLLSVSIAYPRCVLRGMCHDGMHRGGMCRGAGPTTARLLVASTNDVAPRILSGCVAPRILSGCAPQSDGLETLSSLGPCCTRELVGAVRSVVAHDCRFCCAIAWKWLPMVCPPVACVCVGCHPAFARQRQSYKKVDQTTTGGKAFWSFGGTSHDWFAPTSAIRHWVHRMVVILMGTVLHRGGLGSLVFPS